MQTMLYKEEDTDPEVDLVCLPNFQFGRRIPKWQPDSPQNRDGSHNADPEACNKYSNRKTGYTPGLFCLFCPHGYCLGFSLMTKKEGLSTLFNLLYTRFKEAPRMVIYDNAFNLHRYALSRAPEFFENTLFVVDRFHFKGHVA